MPDQEYVAAATPPVAPTQPVPSMYDGLRVRLAPFVAAADAAVGGSLIRVGASKANELVNDVYDEAKQTALDPDRRVKFLTGAVTAGPEGEELGAEAAKLYEGLRVRKAADPAALAKDAGLVYKNEAVTGSGVHMFEHPDHPGKTMAVKQADLSSPESLKTRMDSKLAEFEPKVTNASGESAASKEAINRLSAEKLGDQKRIKIDTRSGKETPLIGVDAVDARPQPHEAIVMRGPKGDTLLDKGAKANYKNFRQDSRQDKEESMDDPDTRFNTARHEAGHAVISELLRPNSVQEVGLDDSGGYTNASRPAGKTETKQLTPDEIRNLVAVSYAGGMSEPGGTTAKHVGPDQTRRADILMGGAATAGANLARLAAGKTLGKDKFLAANQEQAEARARVNALLADPKNRAAIDSLAAKISEHGKLSGDDVRKFLGQ